MPEVSPSVETESTHLQSLLNSGESFDQAVRGAIEREQASVSRTIDAASVVQSIHDSVGFFSGFVGLVQAANALGSKYDGRSLEEAKHVIPLTALAINGENRQDDAETLLLKLYMASHEGIDLPDWFSFIRKVVRVENSSKKLPSAEDYARGIKDLAESKAQCERLHMEYKQLNGRIDDGKGEMGPSGSDTHKAQLKWLDAQQKLGEDLVRLKVDPENSETCANMTACRVSPNLTVVNVLCSYLHSLESFIAELTKDADEILPEDLKLPEVFPGFERGGEDKLIGVRLRSLPKLSSVPKTDFQKCLPQIIDAYASMRQLVFNVYDIHKATNTPEDPDERQAYHNSQRKLSDVLGSVFSKDNTVPILSALMEREDAGLQPPLRKLLFSKVVDEVEHGSPKLFLSDRKNACLLPEAMRAIIDGDEYLREQINSDSSRFKGFVSVGNRIRHAVEKGERRDLADFIERELKRCTADGSGSSASYEERMGLLVGLATVTDDPSHSRLLKAQLRSKDLIQKLTEKISAEINTDRTSQGAFVESQRIRIESRFSPTLDDYWGKRRLKEDFRRAVADHLALLEKPEIWDGLDPKTVFENGHLIIGKPGVGKGFLVSCVANEFGLPLETVTREQLEASLQNRKKAKDPSGYSEKAAEVSETDLESAFARFLDERIEAAHEKMKKFDSRASILFIDEMEAEFLNRDPSTGDRTELTRTNVMLRVIEKKISENPTIIFMGATNYVEHVDPAAYRVGRFGIPWIIEDTNADDVKEILTANLDVLHVDFDGALDDQLCSRFMKNCEKLTPLTIGQLVNNGISVLRANGEDEVTSLSETVLTRLNEKVDALKARQTARDKLLQAGRDAKIQPAVA